MILLELFMMLASFTTGSPDRSLIYQLMDKVNELITALRREP